MNTMNILENIFYILAVICFLLFIISNYMIKNEESKGKPISNNLRTAWKIGIVGSWIYLIIIIITVIINFIRACIKGDPICSFTS